jgi:hypothetical protein
MAEKIEFGESCSKYLTDILTCDSLSSCKNCQVVVNYLSEVQAELSSARVYYKTSAKRHLPTTDFGNFD